jgi:hypothetical protein
VWHRLAEEAAMLVFLDNSEKVLNAGYFGILLITMQLQISPPPKNVKSGFATRISMLVNEINQGGNLRPHRAENVRHRRSRGFSANTLSSIRKNQYWWIRQYH